MRNRHLTRTAAGLALVAALATAGCSAQAVGTTSEQSTPASAAALAKPTSQEIAGLFTTWNDALATGSAEQVADLYAPDAVLLPTLSNEVRSDRAGIVNYFEHFLLNKPSGTIEREIINVLDENTAVNAGVYVFTLHKDGQESKARARFTFLYERIDGKWLITDHHSSLMPES
ncbi:DUF4440 domain-containing protein [Saccharothrix sp. ALI-22-I]|uniref:SgcJ/EcaC family oxidoreductase n=1 Tax=Saccharothrix sp. ALI-22-I TaxID=1933778 RepID=UPI00097CAAF7|nr:SgcJ/EcaC family oxidoreductase [Saccharothrix sp. ALI-22-I]ONI84856.1 DUF4440 domain-containing protein [Saccharothrix sp. ALI-22-I]